MIKHTDLASIYQQMEQFTRELGLKTKDVGKEGKNGQMEPSSKAFTIEIKRMDLESLNGHLEIITLEILKITRRAAKD